MIKTEIKEWTYEEYPSFDEEVEGVKRIYTSGNEMVMAVKQLLNVMKMEDLECLRITGGGSKNTAWMQIISDVLNKKVIQLESGAGAGYGMALVAASRNEDKPLKTIINKSVKEKNIFYPRLKYVELYNQKYSNYLKIYDALIDIYE